MLYGELEGGRNSRSNKGHHAWQPKLSREHAPCTLLPGKSVKLTAPGWSREVYIQVIGSRGDGCKRRKHVVEIMQLRIVEQGHRMRTDRVEGQFPNPFLQPKQSPRERTMI